MSIVAPLSLKEDLDEFFAASLRLPSGDGQVENSMSAEPERDRTNLQLPTAPREDVEVDEKISQASPHTNRLHDDEENSGIDAGYTYLGQFIPHDITFAPASSLQKRNDVIDKFIMSTNTFISQ